MKTDVQTQIYETAKEFVGKLFFAVRKKSKMTT